MTFLEILKIIMAVVTIATGLISLILPRSVQGFTGLSAPGPRGITEIRAILGGAFIGLGLAPLVLGSPAAYQMLGITYLVIAVARIAGLGGLGLVVLLVSILAMLARPGRADVSGGPR